MKKIGTVLYKEPLVNHNQAEYINYIKDEDKDDNIPYPPTLVVGWKYLKSMKNPSNENLSILEKEVKKNELYWEFSFNENKSQHITGIDMFVRNVPIFYFKANYDYKLIDPVKEKIFDKFNILNWYNSITGDIQVDAIYTYKNKMTYILKDKMIYGIDHNMWDFFGMENAAQVFITTSYTSSPEKNIINDSNGDIFAKYNKIFNGYDNLKRYLVVLLSK